jgi:hypothetical protein
MVVYNSLKRIHFVHCLQEDAMNLDSQVLLDLTAEVLYDLLIKCFTHIGFVVVNPYIWALKMLTVSQKKNWIMQKYLILLNL